jgi:hypothetical protein
MTGRKGQFFVPGWMIVSSHEEGIHAMPWFGQGFCQKSAAAARSPRPQYLNRLDFQVRAR